MSIYIDYLAEAQNSQRQSQRYYRQARKEERWAKTLTRDGRYDLADKALARVDRYRELARTEAARSRKYQAWQKEALTR